MRRIGLAIAIASASCGRIGFAALNASDGGDGDAIVAQPGCSGDNVLLCDNFDRSQPIDATSPWWAMLSCDPAATIDVDGAMTITYPANGTAPATCLLESVPLALAARYQIDYDFTATTTSASGIYPTSMQLVVTLGSANADGIDTEQIGLLLGDDLGANITVVYHYPDVAKSPTGQPYPGYDMADNNGVDWYAFATPCHVTVVLDVVNHVGSAQSTCSTVSGSFVQRMHSMANGLSAAPVLDFGFTLPSTVADPWMLSYDNLVVRALD